MDYQRAVEVIEFFKPRLRQNGLNDLADAIDTIMLNNAKNDAEKESIWKQTKL